ncbi:hypothetical protein N7454_005486 [Penicillium verhagenii]|nr:hypothetical protein N7454_005486 [Penicillium verhagenii]
MASSSVRPSGSPAETNDPGLDQRVSVAFIVLNKFFILLFYVSRYFKLKAVVVPMLVYNTLCYVFYIRSVMTGKYLAAIIQSPRIYLHTCLFEVSRYRRIIAGISVIIILQGLTQAANINNRSCGDVMLFYKSYSIPSLFTDVMILVLPWPVGYNNIYTSLLCLLHRPTILGPYIARLRGPHNLYPRRTLHLHNS